MAIGPNDSWITTELNTETAQKVSEIKMMPVMHSEKLLIGIDKAD